MSEIPKLLTSLSGEKIDTKEKWEKFRRGEVLSLLSEYVYGFRDTERPENLYFNVKEETVFKGMRKKEIECGFNDFSFPFYIYLPTVLFILTETPEKCYLFNDEGNMAGKNSDTEIRDGENSIPVKDITERGFGVVLMPTRNVYPDWKSKGEFKKGVFAAFKPP